MLNYVWLGLLVLGIGTALTTDIFDQSNNKFRNGDSLPVEILLEDSIDVGQSGSFNGKLIVNADVYNDFYKTTIDRKVEVNTKITIDQSDNRIIVFFKVDKSSPEMWKYMANISGKDDDLTGVFQLVRKLNSYSLAGTVILEDVAFAKMKDVTNAALDYAGTAVNIALGLIGIMA